MSEVASVKRPTLKRSCMRDQIRDTLVTRILDGTYPAGTQLKELYLAREFDVSQAPIREALRVLEGAGLVSSERFRGTRVRGADFAEMRESYELRIMLEKKSIALAAPYKPEFLEDLEESVRQMDLAVKTDDSEVHIDNALRFHRKIVESSGNRAFLAVWDSLLWDVRGRIALRRHAEMGKSLRPLVSMHRALLGRLREQDVEGAAQRVEAMLTRVASVFDKSNSPASRG
jgi:DNA-binding GntR family transcriptional regulator